MADREIRGIQYRIVDMETTGLTSEWAGHGAYSFAWKDRFVDFETLTHTQFSVNQIWVEHGVPDNMVSEYTKNSDEYKRYLAQRVTDPATIVTPGRALEAFLFDCQYDEGYQVVQVGSNPGFDRFFLDHWARECDIDLKLHHQAINVAEIAMRALNEWKPVRLEHAIQRLYDKPRFQQTHGAAADVTAADNVFYDFFLQPLLARKRKERGL